MSFFDSMKKGYDEEKLSALNRAFFNGNLNLLQYEDELFCVLDTKDDDFLMKRYKFSSGSEGEVIRRILSSRGYKRIRKE